MTRHRRLRGRFKLVGGGREIKTGDGDTSELKRGEATVAVGGFGDGMKDEGGWRVCGVLVGRG